MTWYTTPTSGEGEALSHVSAVSQVWCLIPASGGEMPWYDYQCEKCGSVFEVQHTMSYSGKVKCRKCGSTRTVKIFQPAGVHFKGSGFYVTDSHKGSSTVKPPEDTSKTTSKKDLSRKSA
jgi:putative FmdB family regulatory protein